MGLKERLFSLGIFLKVGWLLDGKFIVSKEVDIFIEGEFVEQKQEQTAGAANA